MSSISIFPHWLMRRLFGAESAVIRIVNGNLRMLTSTGEKHRILPDFLVNHKLLRRGLLFYQLVLTTDSGQKTFSWLNKKDAEQAFFWLREQGLKQLAPEVEMAANNIRRVLACGYPRQSRIKAVQMLAAQTQARFGEVPEPEWCMGIATEPFQRIASVAAWTKRDIRNQQQAYVEHKLHTYSHFFDQVESQPLTARQREACIVDEDNNLVLAGAGTGKTSVMIGRAGFLLKDKQLEANEILMLAFANKAAAEMQQRIKTRLGECEVTVRTFHKLGKEIITKVEGKQPSLSPLAEDDKALAQQVNQWFEEHLKTPGYQRLSIQYFQHYLYPATNPFDFKTEGEYFESLVANEIRSLKGEEVKSLGECLVANYLFKQGIEYQYEAPYKYETATALHRQYQPDFYLPELDIYIEYYGIDRQGNTAPYIDRETYHQGMDWKRQLHYEKGTNLIELYHYQLVENQLFNTIDEQLAAFNAQYQPLSDEAVLSTLREFGAVSRLALLLSDLLKRYRTNCYEGGQLASTIATAKDPTQVQAAMDLLQPILADYQALLDKHKQIDFDDMIGKAIKYVKEGRFQSPWRAILVDEFQDISAPRAKLVRYLRDSVKDGSLFCVGDDWQAIYRFTGSDLSFTTAFKERFGTTKTTALDCTFRFNNSISDIASRFVLKNPRQVQKQLSSLKQVSRPAVSLLRQDNRPQINTGEKSRLQTVLDRIDEIAAQGSSVYVLGRYGFNLPDRHELKALAKNYPSLKLECLTIHASKGKEADYVVILGLESGKSGFPSKKTSHPLLEALLPEQEQYPYAEERRLLYVALTRAKQRVYLITDMAVASDFVVELLKDQYQIELNEFSTSLSQKILHLLKCVKCKTGAMLPRQGEFGHFFACNNYPLCRHTEKACSSCGSQMRRVDRFKVCINAECSSWLPICPKCGADMVKRRGAYGEFWGCKNYRHQGECCKHTENQIQFDSALLAQEEMS